MTPLRLSVIRHAKSSWKHPQLEDHERPLNERGRRDAPRMAARLHARGFRPDLMLTSSATRARITAEIIAEACGLASRLRTSRDLYHASPETLLAIIRAAGGGTDGGPADHLALVGHNPGCTELVAWLVGSEDVDDLPTCGVATLRLDARCFSDVGPGHAVLELLETPKNDPERGAAAAGDEVAP